MKLPSPTEYDLLLDLQFAPLRGVELQSTYDMWHEVPLPKGTLYQSLQRLIATGLVASNPGTEGEDKRLKFYSVTEKGRLALPHLKALKEIMQ